MLPEDITVAQVQALLNERRMTAWDLATVAYYHEYGKPIPAGERDRVTRQLEGRPDAHGLRILNPLPRYILTFL